MTLLSDTTMLNANQIELIPVTCRRRRRRRPFVLRGV